MFKNQSIIAVDLTPVLPGGENGGAKVFVLELLNRLAKIAKDTQFILLTNELSHEELSILDRINMQRMMILSKKKKQIMSSRFKNLALNLFPHLSKRVQYAVYNLGYKVHVYLKRGKITNTLLRDIGANLLFCPFTAPTYSEFGIPTVCVIYDLQFKTYPEFFTTQDVIHRENTFNAACRHATVLTAISEYSRNSALANSNIKPEYIRTIYLRMAQRVKSCKKKINILEHYRLLPKRYLIYPANFWKHKNHEMLLTAFAIACCEALPEDIKLVLTGAPGERQEWLIKASHCMGLGDRVCFQGYLPTDDLVTLIGYSAGVIFPSLYEGFGIPIIEAMALGVPVACSNTTSLPEVAGNAAILFDPRVPKQISRAITDIVKNEVLREDLIQAGKKRSVNFLDGDKMAREYWEIFQYAIKNKNNANQINGVYHDGWIGSCLSIQIAPAEKKQTIEIEFSAPEWLPQKKLIVETIRDGNQKTDSLLLKRGSNRVLSLTINPSGEILRINITPTFRPNRSGHGNDQRKLSAKLKRCGIVRFDGEYIELFPHETVI